DLRCVQDHSAAEEPVLRGPPGLVPQLDLERELRDRRDLATADDRARAGRHKCRKGGEGCERTFQPDEDRRPKWVFATLQAGLGFPWRVSRPFWLKGGDGRGLPPLQPGRTA